MSRGHGKVQQAILLELAYRPANAYQLAQAVYRLPATETPTTAQLVAVRRAIRRLREDGTLPEPSRPPRTRAHTRATAERVAARNRAAG